MKKFLLLLLVSSSIFFLGSCNSPKKIDNQFSLIEDFNKSDLRIGVLENFPLNDELKQILPDVVNFISLQSDDELINALLKKQVNGAVVDEIKLQGMLPQHDELTYLKNWNISESITKHNYVMAKLKTTADYPLAKFSGLRIGYEKGTMCPEQIRSIEKGVDISKLIPFDNSKSLFRNLLRSKVDAICLDEPVALHLLKTIPDFKGLMIMSEHLKGGDVGFAFKRGDPIIKDFNNALIELEERGVLNELKNKWILNKSEDTHLIEQDWAGTKGVLNFPTQEDFPPISYLNSDNEPAGLELDVLLHVAKILDYKVSFSTELFSHYIKSLLSGEYKVIGGGMFINERRKHFVDFSKPYCHFDSVLVAKSDLFLDK